MIKIRHLAVISLVVLLIFMGSCAKKEAPKPKEPEKKEVATKGKDETIQHKVLSFNLEGFTQKGVKNWEVTGKSAEAVSENEVKLNNIVARSFGNEAEAVITADEGVYDKAKNNVRLEKNIRATIENAPGMAGGFVDLPNEARSQSNPKEDTDKKKKEKEKTTVITCDGEVVFDYERNMAYFDKNVKIVNPDGTIDADKITVNLEAETKRVHDIVAEGNVKIKRGENITYSEKATYIEGEKKVVLSGRPRLVIYQEGEFEQSFMKKK